MKQKNKIKSVYLLFVVLLCGCNTIKKDEETTKFVVFDVKNNELKLEVDSILIPTEILIFPIRLKLTNNSNNNIILFFDSVSSKYETKNLLLITSKADTIKLIVRDKHIIFNKYTETSFNVRALCKIDEVTDVELFKKRFLEGTKIIYLSRSNVLTPEFLRFNRKKNDTLFVPKSLQGELKKTIIVHEFLDGSNFMNTKKIK